MSFIFASRGLFLIAVRVERIVAAMMRAYSLTRA